MSDEGAKARSPSAGAKPRAILDDREGTLALLAEVGSLTPRELVVADAAWRVGRGLLVYREA